MRTTITETAFAALVSDPNTAEAMLGDLVETRAEITAARGKTTARRWYRRELARSVPALVWRRLREAPLKVLLWVLLGLLIIGIVDFAVGTGVELLMQLIMDPSSATDLSGRLAIGHLAGGLVAGGVVVRLSRRAPLATAVWVALGWIAWMIISIFLTAVSASAWMLLVPVSNVWQLSLAGGEISIVAGIPDLLVIIGVVAAGLAVALRSGQKVRRTGEVVE